MSESAVIDSLLKRYSVDLRARVIEAVRTGAWRREEVRTMVSAPASG